MTFVFSPYQHIWISTRVPVQPGFQDLHHCCLTFIECIMTSGPHCRFWLRAVKVNYPHSDHLNSHLALISSWWELELKKQLFILRMNVLPAQAAGKPSLCDSLGNMSLRGAIFLFCSLQRTHAQNSQSSLSLLHIEASRWIEADVCY